MQCLVCMADAGTILSGGRLNKLSHEEDCPMKLKGNALRTLRSVHIFAACCWLGTGVSLVLISLAKYMGWLPPETFYGADAAAHLIDGWVLVNTGVILCFATGLLYGFFTEWGFFRHRWIMIKWIFFLACVAFGTWLGTIEKTLLDMSRELGAGASASAEYLSVLRMHLAGGIAQVLAVIFTVAISVFKPWKKKS